MKKYTWGELLDIIHKHNEENNIKSQYSDSDYLSCVAVIDNSSFDKKYSLEARSYRFRSDSKFFLPNMMGKSIFANSLDDTDMGVRLDWYLYGDNTWKIEYCYIEDLYYSFLWDKKTTFGEILWQYPKNKTIEKWAIHPFIDNEKGFVFVIDSQIINEDGVERTFKFKTKEIGHDLQTFDNGINALKIELGLDGSRNTFCWTNSDCDFLKVRIDKKYDIAMEIANCFEKAGYPVEYYDGGDDNVNDN